MHEIREWEAMAKLRQAMRYGSRSAKVRAKRMVRAGLTAGEAWTRFKLAASTHHQH